MEDLFAKRVNSYMGCCNCEETAPRGAGQAFFKKNLNLESVRPPQRPDAQILRLLK